MVPVCTVAVLNASPVGAAQVPFTVAAEDTPAMANGKTAPAARAMQVFLSRKECILILPW